MGVSGAGKTTIGKALAKALSLPFFDADDYHPEQNITKMRQGHPLTDADRQPWLLALNALLHSQKQQGAVLACSALKGSYRSTLQQGLEAQQQFIFLKGTLALIQQRLQARKNHFMPADLLKSQFATLDPPKNAIEIDIAEPPELLVSNLLKQIK